MEGSGTKGWTIEDKYILLVQIIEQLTQGNGRAKIDFKDIHMPGRSEKAISLQWYKIKKEAKDMATNLVATRGPVTPRAGGSVKKAGSSRRTTGSKRKAAPAPGTMGDDFDFDGMFQSFSLNKSSKITIEENLLTDVTHMGADDNDYYTPSKKRSVKKQKAESDGEEMQVKQEYQEDGLVENEFNNSAIGSPGEIRPDGTIRPARGEDDVF
ncbi:hypothetical protein MKZ38_010491 [Zalerion maritima]|uniref:Uncharacterized protein n=1 Tax=Zalerion maritima TaxID=339359 RepID=A0AAD5RU47_9PEZI|nr:hypothetical protein MKZ38_010491 [Zalerion maritima]